MSKVSSGYFSVERILPSSKMMLPGPDMGILAATARALAFSSTEREMSIPVMEPEDV